MPVGRVRHRLSEARCRLQRELGEGDLAYLNEPSIPMQQWGWLPLDQIYALETRVSTGGAGRSASGVRTERPGQTPADRNEANEEEPMERREFLRQAAVGAAGLMLTEPEKEVVDSRLTQKVTCAFKATALSDLCEKLKTDTGIQLTAGDEKVTLFCAKQPLRDVMRQLSRPFGYTWLRSGKPGGYKYELVQDLRSQLLEEELRNRDRNAALIALEREIDRYRPYLGLSPDEALARAQRAPAAEKPLLEKYADVGWAPIQMYFRLSPQELAMLRAGQELIFTEDPKPGERRLPADLKRGVLESNRYYRILRQADRLRVTTDVNLPEALPLTDVPEVKAQLDISIPESELGQFELRGHAGAFIEPGPKTGRGWSNFEGRPPYAVGRGPSYSSGATERTAAPEPRDPALRAPVTLRPQPSTFVI